MNTMARQFGGALGVAGLAVILQSSAGRGMHGYERVYLFCTVLVGIALVVSWVGLRLVPPPAAPATAGTPATAAGMRRAPAGVGEPAE